MTWCPLCGSAVVYDRRHEERTLTFGVSGKLADDDLVMYDRETESEWKQASGECIAGRNEGDTLAVRPAAMLTWKTFRERYPGGVVLERPGGASEAASDDDTPASIDYDDSPYDEYFGSVGFGLAAHRGTEQGREWNRDDELEPKTVVLGIEIGDEAVGVPLPRVHEAGNVVQTTVGGQDIVVFGTEEDGLHGFVDPGVELRNTEAGFEGMEPSGIQRPVVRRRVAFWNDYQHADCSRSRGRTITAPTPSIAPSRFDEISAQG